MPGPESKSTLQRAFLRLPLLVLLPTCLLTFRPVAASVPFSGDWKVTATSLHAGVDLTFAVLRIEDQDGKFVGKLISVPPNFQGAIFEQAQADKSGLRFRIRIGSQTLPFYVGGPTAGQSTKELLGSVYLSDRAEPLRLQRAILKNLDPTKIRMPAAGAEDFRKAANRLDAKEREAGLQEVMTKYAGKPIALAAARTLLQAKARGGADPVGLKSAAAQLLHAAATFGPDLQMTAALEAAQLLSGSQGDSALTMGYAVQAAQWLDQADPPVQTIDALRNLVRILRQGDNRRAAKAVSERVARLEQILDDEMALAPEPIKAVGRTGERNRVVLLELFTGAHCIYCPSAVRAFDALLKTYKAIQVVFCEWHIAGPLICPDSMARWKAYETGRVMIGTPTALINGKVASLPGGAKGNYEALCEALNNALKTQSGTHLKLSARLKGDAWEVLADVSGLKGPKANWRLYFALVETNVLFPGMNGLKVHRNVVRSCPGGSRGFSLLGELKRQTVMVDRTALVKSLEKYLSGTADHAGKTPEGGWPLELKHLKVIAFIQDDASKEVLQAAQVDLPPSTVRAEADPNATRKSE